MGIAILLGIVAGAVGYLPYELAKRLSRKTDPAHPLGYTGWFFFAILLSFAVLFVAVVICGTIARDVLLPFAIAEIAVLFVLVIVFGLIVPRR